MNISQHSFVPFTGYVVGYYNSSKQLMAGSSSRVVSNILMPLPLGVNSFILFNFPRVSSTYATLRIYDPYSITSTPNGIVSMTTGDLFSSTRISTKLLDVRVIGWCQSSVPLGLTQNSVDYGVQF